MSNEKSGMMFCIWRTRPWGKWGDTARRLIKWLYLLHNEL